MEAGGIKVNPTALSLLSTTQLFKSNKLNKIVNKLNKLTIFFIYQYNYLTQEPIYNLLSLLKPN